MLQWLNGKQQTLKNQLSNPHAPEHRTGREGSSGFTPRPDIRPIWQPINPCMELSLTHLVVVGALELVDRPHFNRVRHFVSYLFLTSASTF